MTDIEEIEGRLASALERIGSGVERLRAEAGSGGSAEAEARAEALQEALDAEREAGERLAERLRRATRRHEVQVRRVQSEAEEARARLEEAEAELARQRGANDRLREVVRGLREAAEGGRPPPIDAAMRAELEGLRAARDSDRDEIDAILHELAPLLEREEEA